MDIVTPAVNKLEKMLLNVFNLAAESGNPETFNDPAKKQQFKDHFLRALKVNESMKEELAFIDNFQCSSMDTFDDEYKSEHAKMKAASADMEQSERFKKFSEEIEKVVFIDPNVTQSVTNITTITDGDIVLEETQEFIDPISKTQILDPVKNTICGHIYERSSIYNAMKVNKRLKCAYMGCPNKQPVLMENLADDPQLKAKLLLLHTQKQQAEDEGEAE